VKSRTVRKICHPIGKNEQERTKETGFIQKCQAITVRKVEKKGYHVLIWGREESLSRPEGKDGLRVGENCKGGSLGVGRTGYLIGKEHRKRTEWGTHEGRE